VTHPWYPVVLVAGVCALVRTERLRQVCGAGLGRHRQAQPAAACTCERSCPLTCSVPPHGLPAMPPRALSWPGAGVRTSAPRQRGSAGSATACRAASRCRARRDRERGDRERDRPRETSAERRERIAAWNKEMRGGGGGGGGGGAPPAAGPPGGGYGPPGGGYGAPGGGPPMGGYGGPLMQGGYAGGAPAGLPPPPGMMPPQ